MTATKRVKRTSKKRKNRDFVEIEKIFGNKKDANYELMAKFLLNSDETLLCVKISSNSIQGYGHNLVSK